MDKNEFCKMQNWYPELSGYTFPTSFVKLQPEEVEALADGAVGGPIAYNVIRRLKQPMHYITGNCFVSVDTCAPTDTERFRAKHGSVHSPESAWHFLALSSKVRKAAARNDVSHICLRPFRRMNQTREFRLFIYEGGLVAMSQYWLVRHFRRLEGIKDKLWNHVSEFFKTISWALPEGNLVMDIYVTSSRKILIVDLNPWGEGTDPLLLSRWDRDWDKPAGIKLMPPPTRIFGDVNVSF
ncbi:MAG: hypothetical protein PHV59_07715 [Victivallales bacterium]|nr:hypothetical protein [Victivallales bacterium]